jgi:SAM-dependent methyltransferase
VSGHTGKDGNGDGRPRSPEARGAAARGTGPGLITPDGCAVDFYAMLSARGEPEIIHEAVGPDASILELGAGAGRVTGPLAALGHAVVAVDESPEMLAHITTARTVCSRIEDLDLQERFDVVLLASHLINVPGDQERHELLAACARHVSPSGCVLIEQHAPDWFETASESESEADGIVFRLRDISRPPPGLLSATVEYQSGDRVWTQTFTTRRLSTDQLAAALTEAGLALDRYLTPDHSWLRAVPA